MSQSPARKHNNIFQSCSYFRIFHAIFFAFTMILFLLLFWCFVVINFPLRQFKFMSPENCGAFLKSGTGAHKKFQNIFFLFVCLETWHKVKYSPGCMRVCFFLSGGLINNSFSIWPEFLRILFLNEVYFNNKANHTFQFHRRAIFYAKMNGATIDYNFN